MPTIEKKSLNQPEEVNKPEKLKMEAITIRGLTIRRVTTHPENHQLPERSYPVCHLGQTGCSYG
jgi:hypothetical protein